MTTTRQEFSFTPEFKELTVVVVRTSARVSRRGVPRSGPYRDCRAAQPEIDAGGRRRPHHRRTGRPEAAAQRDARATSGTRHRDKRGTKRGGPYSLLPRSIRCPSRNRVARGSLAPVESPAGPCSQCTVLIDATTDTSWTAGIDLDGRVDGRYPGGKFVLGGNAKLVGGGTQAAGRPYKPSSVNADRSK